MSGPAVAVFVFNRPHLVARAMAPLRQMRPEHVLIVADHGRSPDEHVLVKQSVAAAQAGIDWHCQVDVDAAAQHLGCRLRFESGLDWVFSQTSAAVLLEDDVEVSPAYLAFAEEALRVFADNPAIRCISARNVLVQYPEGEGAFLARKESIWGWASWSDRWKSYREGFAVKSEEELASGIQRHASFPLHARLQEHLLRSRLWEKIDTWDIPWSIWNLATDGWTLTPPANLSVNHGMGEGATHTRAGDDVRARYPLLNVRPTISSHPVPRIEYDRYFTLLELALNLDNPRRWKTLARTRERLPEVFRTPGWRVMIDVFEYPAELRWMLGHLRKWMVHPQLDALQEVFDE